MVFSLLGENRITQEIHPVIKPLIVHTLKLLLAR